jgi:hypothetical protein
MAGWRDIGIDAWREQQRRRWERRATLAAWATFSAIVLGALVLDLTRGSWDMHLGPRIAGTGRAMAPLLFMVPPWWITIPLALGSAWLIRRMHVSSQRLACGFIALAFFVPGYVVSAIYVSEYPDKFSLPSWWLGLWALWIAALLLYAFAGPRR